MVLPRWPKCCWVFRNVCILCIITFSYNYWSWSYPISQSPASYQHYSLTHYCTYFPRLIHGPHSTNLKIPADDFRDGNDVPWSSFELKSAPPPNLKVLLGTAAYQTIVVVPEGCTALTHQTAPVARRRVPRQWIDDMGSEQGQSLTQHLPTSTRDTTLSWHIWIRISSLCWLWRALVKEFGRFWRMLCSLICKVDGGVCGCHCDVGNGELVMKSNKLF